MGVKEYILDIPERFAFSDFRSDDRSDTACRVPAKSSLLEDFFQLNEEEPVGWIVWQKSLYG